MRILIPTVLIVSSISMSDPALQTNSGSWGEPTEYGQQLRSAKRETVQGNILYFHQTTPPGSQEPGVAMKLQTDKGILDVHLGPRWFLLERDTQLTAGQAVSIVGLRIQLEKSPVLVAEKVRREGSETILRERSELQRVANNPPVTDPDIAALTILGKRCATCHQSSGHPGAAFLSQEGLDDKQITKKVIQVLSSGKMPPDHKNFRNTVEGKLVLDWLKSK